MTEIPKWHLHRDYHEVEKNTSLGRLTGTGTLKAPIELQTVENFKRRIPAGHTYRCRRDYWYNGSRVTFEIIWPWDEDGDGDPDRDRILFHPANAVRSASGELLLLGCVAPGFLRLQNFWEKAGRYDIRKLGMGLPGVTNSVKAFNQFMDANVGLHEFDLIVTENDP